MAGPIQSLALVLPILFLASSNSHLTKDKTEHGQVMKAFLFVYNDGEVDVSSTATCCSWPVCLWVKFNVLSGCLDLVRRSKRVAICPI